METDIGFWQNLLAEHGASIVQFVGLLLVLGIAWSKSEFRKLAQSKTKAGLVREALLWLNDLVWDLVGEAEQVAVRELKTALADDKIDKAEYAAGLKAIKDAIVAEALERAFGRLSADGAAASMGEAETLIASKVENAVRMMKAPENP